MEGYLFYERTIEDVGRLEYFPSKIDNEGYIYIGITKSINGIFFFLSKYSNMFLGHVMDNSEIIDIITSLERDLLFSLSLWVCIQIYTLTSSLKKFWAG